MNSKLKYISAVYKSFETRQIKNTKVIKTRDKELLYIILLKLLIRKQMNRTELSIAQSSKKTDKNQDLDVRILGPP